MTRLKLCLPIVLLMLVIFLPGTIFAEETISQMIKGIEHINAGKYEEALSEFKFIIDSGTAISNVRLCMGICYLNQGKFGDAEIELEQEIKLNPSSPQSYHFLAMISEYRGEKQKALDCWRKFIELTGNKKLKKSAVKHIKHLKEK